MKTAKRRSIARRARDQACRILRSLDPAREGIPDETDWAARDAMTVEIAEILTECSNAYLFGLLRSMRRRRALAAELRAELRLVTGETHG